MNRADSDRTIVFRTPHRRVCGEMRLVLEAAGIASDAFHSHGEWSLAVLSDHEEEALIELEEYRNDKEQVRTTVTEPIPVFEGAMEAAFGYAVVMFLIDLTSSGPETREIWHSVGAMKSQQVMSGELWRTVTALTLHVDLKHLLSNIVFGCFFGILVGRILGGGVAWLAIMLAGALGNGINALIRPGEHTSIGASTAVFGALGMMVVHALQPRFRSVEKRMRRWSPLIAGAALLGFIGVGGERTDVVAHVTGFFSGMLFGWIAVRLPEKLMEDRRTQYTAGFICFSLVVLAWIVAASTVAQES